VSPYQHSATKHVQSLFSTFPGWGSSVHCYCSINPVMLHAVAIGCCAVGLSATLSRIITVTSPCAANEYFCPDDKTCSQVQCSLRNTLPTNDVAQNDSVSVVLLPTRGLDISEAAGANRSVYLEYGK
jgi:hypothetical protein